MPVQRSLNSLLMFPRIECSTNQHIPETRQCLILRVLLDGLSFAAHFCLVSFDSSLRCQITFVSHQEFIHTFTCVTIDFLEPLFHIVEWFLRAKTRSNVTDRWTILDRWHRRRRWYHGHLGSSCSWSCEIVLDRQYPTRTRMLGNGRRLVDWARIPLQSAVWLFFPRDRSFEFSRTRRMNIMLSCSSLRSVPLTKSTPMVLM